MESLVPVDTTCQLTATALLAHSPPQTTKDLHSPPSSTSGLDNHSLLTTHTKKKAKLANPANTIDLDTPLPIPSSTSDGGSKNAAVVHPSGGGGRTSHPRRGAKDDFGGEGKEFLTQGLYWSAGMSRPSVVVPKSGSSGREDRAARQKEAGWKEVDNLTVLPLPLYHGETLLEEERAFKLPFDLAPEWVDDIREVSVEVDEGEKGTMAREKSRKPEPYGHLSRSAPSHCCVRRTPQLTSLLHLLSPQTSTSVASPTRRKTLPSARAFLPRATRTPAASRASTGSFSSSCGRDLADSTDDRMMQYSCDPKTCPSGDKCSNKPLALQEGIPEGKNGLRVIWVRRRSSPPPPSSLIFPRRRLVTAALGSRLLSRSRRASM